MKNNINVIFFDLFFTLVTPRYNDLRNENDVLKITKEEWEIYAEDKDLYEKRATGKEKVNMKIIEDIIKKMKIEISDIDKNEILTLREERFKQCLLEISPVVIEALSKLKRNGKRLCLISNADVIDVRYWDKSPLYNLFDDAIFSCEVGYLKPQIEIYNIALNRMRVKSEECIFIGDGGSDELKSAKELGMKTILTSYLLKRDEEQLNILKEYADYHIEDFKEIETLLLS
ncbi:putative hydrolase of the HAD superfamily [Clostridium cavendishii DSM 21758]|uniref:Putative hydrolase of the HAD superfamily n=1 Tax=Clostridium cavendishii DSM 21758 TaxID=1121302 RepID=A0A1M6GH09_9CLOT|nr:HAD family hydrolase [Clostridium cavendishii]SHJ09198.1 putative hydrolase of the HAD superfamily [Clostridium cavendishii DSM 21758]